MENISESIRQNPHIKDLPEIRICKALESKKHEKFFTGQKKTH